MWHFIIIIPDVKKQQEQNQRVDAFELNEVLFSMKFLSVSAE